MMRPESEREQGAAAPMKRGLSARMTGGQPLNNGAAPRPLSLLSSCGGSDGEANTDPTTKA